jgi:5-methylcytosine-specific restriction endonuclease McrA
VSECRARFGFSEAAWAGAVRRAEIVPRARAMPIEVLLSAPRGRHHLKRRLLQAGLLESVCRHCGLERWQDMPLALQLHHLNGDRHDNRLENLALLCPNCHSQTDTWAGRNGRESPAGRRTDG